MKLAPTVIRRATAEDASAIEELYRELVSDASICVLPEQIAMLSASPAGLLMVAEAGGIVRATVLLSICQDVMHRKQPFGVIENIVVTQAMRGHGIGRILLAYVEDLANAHDCTKLMLSSSTKRNAAHGFFRHCGFSSDTKHAFVKYHRQFSVGQISRIT